MSGDGPDKQMIDTAGAVADFAYKQGIGDAIAVDHLIQKYRALRVEAERLQEENRILRLRVEELSEAWQRERNHEISDAVRERSIRHLPVNGPDDRQPNGPSTVAGRRAASAGGRSSEQDENGEKP